MFTLECALGAVLLAVPEDTPAPLASPSPEARHVADLAVQRYAGDVVETLRTLVAFDTFHRDGTENARHPSFQAMTAYLRGKAEELGLDFADHGAVVVLGLGDAPARLGVVTHGDVQPADPAKWARSPFLLDEESEPGRLVGRGTEDDKGPIAAALYAMKALKDRGTPLQRRIELIISYTEESDWQPFLEFLDEHPAPELNVALDAEYPVVTAEKGWCSLHVDVPLEPAPAAGGPALEAFRGGFFLSQVPEDAEAVLRDPTPEQEAALREAARATPAATFEFVPAPGRLTLRARGRSAHSSRPEEGVNAITHLAHVLAAVSWPPSPAATMVDFLDSLVGTGFLAERFGDLAYHHPFMGPLTLSVGTLREEDGALRCGINLRRPAGRSSAEVEAALRGAVEAWQRRTGHEAVRLEVLVTEPHLLEDAPHVPVLLGIFRHYTGAAEARPIAIGGGTHARLVPAGVNFGPAMPGEPYTGHSEHEYLPREQLELNLRMYAAMLTDLCGSR